MPDCQSNKQNFPFRTLAMLVSLGSCLLGSVIFTDPHPLSPDNEETPFYRKGKTPLGTNCQSPNQEVQIVDKMRLEGIILKMIQNRISLLWVFKLVLIGQRSLPIRLIISNKPIRERKISLLAHLFVTINHFFITLLSWFSF